MASLSDRAENNHADFFSHTYFNWNGTLYQAAIFANFIAYQYYWTSSTDAADRTQAWTVFSCVFGIYDTPKENLGYTLAVRSAQETTRTGRGSNLVRGPGVF